MQSINVQNSNRIVLNGAGFNSNPDDNLIMIGETNCNVVSANENQLECEPDDGPLGSYYFKVNVLGKGYAVLSPEASETTFTFELDAFSISPNTSGTGGGIIVDLVGKGFSSNTRVLIDGTSCPIQNYTYSKISCMVPANVRLNFNSLYLIISVKNKKLI